MTWHTDRPKRQGEYLILDTWQNRAIAQYRLDIGWCVRGRWLGHDGAHCWMGLDFLPEVPK